MYHHQGYNESIKAKNTLIIKKKLFYIKLQSEEIQQKVQNL